MSPGEWVITSAEDEVLQERFPGNQLATQNDMSITEWRTDSRCAAKTDERYIALAQVMVFMDLYGNASTSQLVGNKAIKGPPPRDHQICERFQVDEVRVKPSQYIVCGRRKGSCRKGGKSLSKHGLGLQGQKDEVARSEMIL